MYQDSVTYGDIIVPLIAPSLNGITLAANCITFGQSALKTSSTLLFDTIRKQILGNKSVLFVGGCGSIQNDAMCVEVVHH